MPEAALQPFVTSQRPSGVASRAATQEPATQWTWQATPNPTIEAGWTTTWPARLRGSAASEQNKLGNYYCWNRIYEPSTGRWTTPDPAASPWTTLFSFVFASPVGTTDATGLQAAPERPAFDEGASSYSESPASLGVGGRVRISAGKSNGRTMMQIEVEGCCNCKFYQIVNRSLSIVQRSSNGAIIKSLTTDLNGEGYTLKAAGGEASLDGKDDLDNLNSKHADVIGAGGVGASGGGSCWMSDTPDVSDSALKALYSKANSALIKSQGLKYHAYDERELVLTLHFTTYIMCDSKLRYTVKWQTAYAYNQRTGAVSRNIVFSAGDNSPIESRIPKDHQDLIDGAGK